jgi:hypothetical protein
MDWMKREGRAHLSTPVAAAAAEIAVAVLVSGIAEADIENDHQS